jgi:hypothetical protein
MRAKESLNRNLMRYSSIQVSMSRKALFQKKSPANHRALQKHKVDEDGAMQWVSKSRKYILQSTGTVSFLVPTVRTYSQVGR